MLLINDASGLCLIFGGLLSSVELQWHRAKMSSTCYFLSNRGHFLLMQVMTSIGINIMFSWNSLETVVSICGLWTEKPGRLQSIGSQRIGYDWLQLTHTPFLAMTEYKCVGQSSSSYMRATQKGKWPGWSKVQSDFTHTKLSKAYMKLVNTQLVRVNSRRIVKRIMKWHTIVFVFVCCFVFLE